MQRYLSEKRRQFRRGLLLGACISVAIVVPATKYWWYRHENRDFQKAPAELPAQTSGSARPSESTKPTAPTNASANILRSGNQNNAAAKGRAASIPATETGGHSVLQTWGAPTTSPSTRAPLDATLSGNTSRQKPAMTPQQLWASVQTGDTKAAVALAELYIKGQGVPQNCNQARVLLLVASEKRNAEAIKRLQELDKSDCPSN